MRTHVALLRGINVGGNKKVKMAELKAMLEELGMESPATLLQSGNVVFGSKEKEDALERLLEKETEERLGVKCGYFVRTAKEWEKLIAANPFPAMAKDDPSHLLVIFLRESPDAEAVKKVQEAIEGPEVIRIEGNHLFVTYPDGIGTSTLPKTPGWTKLGAIGTGRNWNTVLKLGEMLKE